MVVDEMNNVQINVGADIFRIFEVPGIWLPPPQVCNVVEKGRDALETPRKCLRLPQFRNEEVNGCLLEINDSLM